jgi:hypothetical protein
MTIASMKPAEPALLTHAHMRVRVLVVHRAAVERLQSELAAAVSERDTARRNVDELTGAMESERAAQLITLEEVGNMLLDQGMS